MLIDDLGMSKERKSFFLAVGQALWLVGLVEHHPFYVALNKAYKFSDGSYCDQSLSFASDFLDYITDEIYKKYPELKNKVNLSSYPCEDIERHPSPFKLIFIVADDFKITDLKTLILFSNLDQQLEDIRQVSLNHVANLSDLMDWSNLHLAIENFEAGVVV